MATIPCFGGKRRPPLEIRLRCYHVLWPLPSMNLFVTVRLHERHKLLQPWLEVFLIIPPTPDRAFEDRFCDVRVTGRTHRLLARVLMEKQHALIPIDAEEIQYPPRRRFQILH